MRIAQAFPSIDGITTKYVLDAGGAFVECTHVDRTEKHIICFSTAVGCPVACGFCAATAFRRRLTAQEMIAQVQAVLARGVADDSPKPVLFSAMGEGEPLLSMAAGQELVRTLERLLVLRRGSRAAISTTAIKPRVVRWLAESAPRQLKLQISIHAPTDAQRRQIIPSAAPLAQVIEAGRVFLCLRPGQLEWNYVLISGLNDRDEDAYCLSRLLNRRDRVKLNRLNPVPGVSWRPSERSQEFASILRTSGLDPEHYCTDGVDVAAACGQLKSRVGETLFPVRSSKSKLVTLT